jgi:hypothetical protein
VTPGLRTSEFKVTVLAVIAALVSALQDYVSDPTAVKLGIGASVAYVLSRGLAKYEGRTGTPPTPPAA